MQALPGFQEGGRLYGGRDELFAVTNPNLAINYNINAEGDPVAMAYGLDDLPLSRLRLLDGEIDMEKLKSGKYILEGVALDDNSNPEWEYCHFDVGDTVTLHNYKGTSEGFDGREYTSMEYEVLAHVAVNNYTNSIRSGWDYNFYLPTEIFKPLVARPAVMTYAFNMADEKEAEAESFLKAYTDSVEPLMNYDSKFTAMASFSGLRNTVLVVGGALGILIALIGILNFCNAMLTSIITRRQELAMLQSIGMTKGQLRKMIWLEGIFYAALTGLTAIVLGVLCSVVIVKALCGQLWFMSYQFLILPLLLSLPILLIVGTLIPLGAFLMTDNESIVERLRTAE